MARMVKHLALLGLSLPLGLLGYHFVLGQGAADASAETASRRLVDAVQGLTLGDDHDLARLELLERCFYYVEQRYVEKERLDPEAMFDGALDLVERRVNEVMFLREPRGRRLQVSVGSYTTVLLLDPIDDFSALTGELRRVAQVLDAHLSEDVEKPEVEYALINGALSVLDPHSVLLPPAAAREMEVDNQGEFGGLGIEIINRDGRLIVKSAMDGSPAHAVGLMAGDHVIRIEDESTINMDLNDAVTRLRGEVGTPVHLLVERKGLSKPRLFTIVRDTIRVNPVEGQLLEGDIGYIRIKNFNRQVSSDLDEKLSLFRREATGGLRGLVLDLRGNPGGYLNQAYEVSNRFLSDGVIVSTVEGGNRRRDEQRATRPGTEPDYPIAVLVNGNSASASEIVAGALRNQERAIIIGERTFGKGSVQHLYGNPDDSSLKLTVAKYLTPGDHSIQSVGIPPDILLQPVLARAKGDAPDSRGQISMFGREWIDREASLDRHLENEPEPEAGAVFSLRYLRTDGAGDEGDDPRRDWEVGFAREVLLAASSASRRHPGRRLPVVARHQQREEERVERALAALALNWSSDKSSQALPALDVRLDLGEDGVLVAGQSEVVALEVTNRGDQPVLRLSAVTDSDNPWLNHREFFFGRVDPGQTARFEQVVQLHDGYHSEVASVDVRLRGQDGAELFRAREFVETVGHALPALAYTLQVFDDGSGTSRGDGDGIPEVGERIDIEISVVNVGAGATRGGFARLKNRSGRGLDLVTGSLSLGTEQSESGEACETGSAGCRRELAPGETSVGRVSFELRDPPTDDRGWELEVMVGDNERFDYATVQQGGFYDYFQLDETLWLSAEAPLEPRQRRPPSVVVTRASPLRSDAPDAVVSGLVTDDRGIRDVMVFHGEEKIFYRGGNADTTSIPFSADPVLEAGPNMIYVLARDYEGLSATWSASTWYAEPESTAHVSPVPDPQRTLE